MSDAAHCPVALVLSGGGLTGALYEVGCLAALEAGLRDFKASSFQGFVAASSGAPLATALAGGYSAQRIYRALLDPADDFFPIQRHNLVRFDAEEMKRAWGATVRAARRILSAAAARPLSRELTTELERFYDSLPAGFFSIDSFEKFMLEFMVRRGIPRRFAELERPLRLVANDLDEGKRAVFGREPLAEVSIPRAIAAACAVPVLYAPVRIGRRDYMGGGLGETGNVDLVTELDAEVALVVSAAVPVRTDPAVREIPTGYGPMKRVRDKGMLWIHNQSWRMLEESHLRQGLRQLEVSHPKLHVQLLTPAPADATILMRSPMKFASRRTILEYGYTSTLRLLRDPSSTLRQALEQCGLEAA